MVIPENLKEIERDTFKAIKDNARLSDSLACERIYEEIRKIEHGISKY